MTTEAINVTSRSPADFIELDEDVSASPLWNTDLAPTTIAQRTWSTWNIAALWIGMSVVISTYAIAGAMIADGMTWWQAMLTVLLANWIVLIPMCLNAHAGTKYGIAFPVLLRASFGTRGANIPAVLRAIVACGWFGIQTWIGGTAIDSCFAAISEKWAQVPGHTGIAFFLFWAIQVFFILRGLEGIKWLESFAAPLLLLGGVVLLWWAANKAGGLGRVLDASSALEGDRKPFWSIFPAHLTANVAYWSTLTSTFRTSRAMRRANARRCSARRLGCRSRWRRLRSSASPSPARR
jgi:nucleobase:cation symporter-1, NCS1 family